MKQAVFFMAIFFTTISYSFCQQYPAENDKEYDNGCNIVFPKCDNLLIENLDLLGKIWGFLKYNHPAIGEGDYNWDYELLRFLPVYLKAISKKQRDKILLAWIDKYGVMPPCNICKETSLNAYLKPDFSWLGKGNVSKLLENKILEIYHKRHQGEHYYISIDEIGNPTFLHENPYSNMLTCPEIG